MSIKLVKILNGCISCGACERSCPKVFKINGTSQVQSQDFSETQNILQAKENCPVQVIHVEEDTASISQKPVAKAAQLIKKTCLTYDVCEFQFQTTDFQFQAGQFVSCVLPTKNGELLRSYSIAEGTDTSFTLCIKLGNSDSAEFLKNLETGDSIQFFGPRGSFIFQNSEKEKVFIGTGTGIAPLLAMMAACPEEQKKTLIFGLRSETDVFYTDRFKKIKNLNCILTLSDPAEDFQGYRGRVTEHFTNISQDAEIYICGSPVVIDSVCEKLSNHPKDHIFFESFAGAKPNTIQSTPEQKSFINNNFLSQIIFQGIIPGKEYFQRFLLILAAITPLIWYFPEQWRDFGWISWGLLMFIMVIRPLADVFPKIQLFNSLVNFRKETGILCAALVLAHGAGFYLENQWPIFTSFFDFQYWTFNNNAGYAHVGGLLAFILLITSNIWSQKLLKQNWKRVQYLAYFFFLVGGAHIVLIGGEHSFDILLKMIFIIILWILAFKKVVLWKK